MKIVVTGAAGHIGSRLIREIPMWFDKPQITMLDDLSTQRFCSLFNLPDSGQYEFLEADVQSAELIPVFTGADVVIHLAAITDATSSFGMKDRVEAVNLGGVQRVAQACLSTKSPLIFLSTTSVYGSQAQLVDEDCPFSDLKPQSPYAESKLRAEQLLHQMGAEGLRHVICRFGTIFGTSEGMRFHTAINKFCWQAVMGQPVTVWRTALNQYRPYLDLGDAIEAIKFVIQRQLYDCQIYNVVTTNASVRKIVDVIAGYVSGISIQYVDTEIMNQLSYHVSNERFKNLGFEFRGSLERGIRETVRLLERSNGVHLRGRKAEQHG